MTGLQTTLVNGNKFDPTKVDLERMAKRTGLGIPLIKVALGLPLTAVCTATTIEEANAAWAMAPEGSEDGFAALEVLCALSMKAAREASTVEEAREVYEIAPLESAAGEAAAKRWLSLCKTPEQVEILLHKLSPDSELYRVATRELASFFQRPE